MQGSTFSFFYLENIYIISPHVNESMTALDSGFHALHVSSLCQWNLDSGFQSLVGFRIA